MAMSLNMDTGVQKYVKTDSEHGILFSVDVCMRVKLI